MLILTRRVGETINIGDGVRVTVLTIKGNQVRIGIEAPREIPVHRQEIYERIKKEKEATKNDDAPHMGKAPESLKKPKTATNVPVKKARVVQGQHHNTNLGATMVAARVSGNK